MDKELVKAAVKLFLGMIALGTGSTLVKKAGKDAGKSKLNWGKNHD